MVCEPNSQHTESVTQYLMPGGRLEESSDIECLQNEIKEELDCKIDTASLELIGEYTDIAASRLDRNVMIRLYKGRIIGEPKPSTEIGALHWINRKDVVNPKVSAIIRNKIIPDLVLRNILN